MLNAQTTPLSERFSGDGPKVMGVSPVSFSYFSLSSPSFFFCFCFCFFLFFFKRLNIISVPVVTNWHILRDHACLFAGNCDEKLMRARWSALYPVYGPMIICYILHTLEQLRGYFPFPLYSFILVSPAPPPYTPSLKYSGYHSYITVPFRGGWCSLW